MHIFNKYINLQNSWALKDVVEIISNMKRIEELETLFEETGGWDLAFSNKIESYRQVLILEAFKIRI